LRAGGGCAAGRRLARGFAHTPPTCAALTARPRPPATQDAADEKVADEEEEEEEDEVRSRDHARARTRIHPPRPAAACTHARCRLHTHARTRTRLPSSARLLTCSTPLLRLRRAADQDPQEGWRRREAHRRLRQKR
jgi:hypothetical protein